MTIQKTTGGNLLRLTAGSMAKECCCGTGETTACSLEAPCANGDPSMQVTVFDADYALGDITWCGETWTNQQVKDGDTRCVCPLLWNNIGYSSASYFGQRWAYSGGLSLQRGNSFQGGPRHEIRLATAGNTYYDNGLSAGPPRFFNFGNTIGVLTTGSPWVVANSDSNINNHFFGANQSLTYGSLVAGGIEYRWAKGVGWP